MNPRGEACNLTYRWNLKKRDSKLIDTENRWLAARDRLGVRGG